MMYIHELIKVIMKNERIFIVIIINTDYSFRIDKFQFEISEIIQTKNFEKWENSFQKRQKLQFFQT